MAGFLTPVKGGDMAGATHAPINPLPDIAVVLPDTPDASKKNAQDTEIQVTGLAGFVREKFTRAEMAKRPFEQRAMDSYRNYRGLYGPDQMFTETERSRVFVKVTKTKVFAAYGQLIDIFFANNTFPISVEPERLPGGFDANYHIETDPNSQQAEDAVSENGAAEGQDQQQPQSPVGFPGDGSDLKPGFSIPAAVQAFIGKLRGNEKLNPGPSTSPSSIDINPYERAAKEVEKQILDQLKFSEADKHLRHAAFENVLFGTCIIKGPLAATKNIDDWDESGQYIPKQVVYPKISSVSFWNFYPDPDATSIHDSQFAIERHSLSRSQLLELKSRPFFRPTEINLCIGSGFNYTRLWWEQAIKDIPAVAIAERYEVLEYWGTVDSMNAKEYGIENLPEEFKDQIEVPVNIWVCNGRVIRLVFNPFNPKRIPYFVIPHEIQPYIVWGVGVAENMSDSQQLMNGFMRMAVDNATISGNNIFEIDESRLIPGQDYGLYPGKFFRTQPNGDNRPALNAIQIPNVAAENIQLFDKARELADEATFPSYTHGQTGINPSLGRTSSGISMMMGASSVVIRNVVKNFDDYLFVPLGEAMYAFNRQFNPSKRTGVNIIIKAGGTDSLMKNEVKSQKLGALMQLCLNPSVLPFVKVPQLLREQFKALDLDPDTLTNTSSEAQRQALFMRSLMQQQGMPPEGGQPGQPPGPEDQGMSRASTPGEKGFSAAKSNPNEGMGMKNGQ